MGFLENIKAKVYPLYLKHKAEFPNVPFEHIVGLISVENASINPSASRFEEHVYSAAVKVKNGGVSNSFPGFNSGALKTFIQKGTDQDLRTLCSSWGLGQLMGYHYVNKWGLSAAAIRGLDMEKSLVYMMKFYQSGLQYAKTYPELLRWWNTGSTKGKTYHANYVPNATAMAEKWKAFIKGEAAPAPVSAPPVQSLNDRIKAQLDIIDAAQKEIRRLLG